MQTHVRLRRRTYCPGSLIVLPAHGNDPEQFWRILSAHNRQAPASTSTRTILDQHRSIILNPDRLPAPSPSACRCFGPYENGIASRRGPVPEQIPATGGLSCALSISGNGLTPSPRPSPTPTSISAR